MKNGLENYFCIVNYESIKHTICFKNIKYSKPTRILMLKMEKL